MFEQVVSEILRHPLGEGRDEDALIARRTLPDLIHEVIDLALRGLHDDLRIHQAGGPDHLLNDLTTNPAELIGARSGRQVDRLADPLDELGPTQGPVVHGTWQPETVIHQGPLAAHVTLVHRTDLRDRHM